MLLAMCLLAIHAAVFDESTGCAVLVELDGAAPAPTPAVGAHVR